MTEMTHAVQRYAPSSSTPKPQNPNSIAIKLAEER